MNTIRISADQLVNVYHKQQTRLNNYKPAAAVTQVTQDSLQIDKQKAGL
jgi:hypothetical protein